MPEKDELDLLLDSALATYADPGPDYGLEERVLSALGAERATGRKRRAGMQHWLPWVIGIPLAASLLLWAGMDKYTHSPSVQKQEAHRLDQVQIPSIVRSAPTIRAEPQNGKHGSGAKAHLQSGPLMARLKPCPDTKPNTFVSAGGTCPLSPQGSSTGTQAVEKLPLPKLDVFPTPQPLTPQERALASITTQAPVPLRTALVAAQEQDDDPVRIAAIHIPPIEPPSEAQH